MHPLVCESCGAFFLSPVSCDGMDLLTSILYPPHASFSTAGDVIVVDSDNSRVQVFGSDLRLRVVLGSRGSLPHQFNQPMCVSLTRDPAENLVITDSANASVKVRAAAGDSCTGFIGAPKEERELEQRWRSKRARDRQKKEKRVYERVSERERERTREKERERERSEKEGRKTSRRDGERRG